MFRITNKGTIFDVSTCVKFRKSKQFAKTTLIKKQSRKSNARLRHLGPYKETREKVEEVRK